MLNIDCDYRTRHCEHSEAISKSLLRRFTPRNDQVASIYSSISDESRIVGLVRAYDIEKRVGDTQRAGLIEAGHVFRVFQLGIANPERAQP